MGLIGNILGGAPAVGALGSAVTNVAEVFVQNSTRRMELDEAAYGHAVGQFGREFESTAPDWFNQLINGLNRLPRPALALGTMGLFVYAMVEPVGFGLRMQRLQLVPEPLWWLLGAVVSFYFGAREAHYFRHRRDSSRPLSHVGGTAAPSPNSYGDNAALRDWAANERR